MESCVREEETEKEKAVVSAAIKGDAGALTALLQMGVSPNVQVWMATAKAEIE